MESTQEKITVHEPSYIKDHEEKITKMKEKIESQKRELEELEKKFL